MQSTHQLQLEVVGRPDPESKEESKAVAHRRPHLFNFHVLTASASAPALLLLPTPPSSVQSSAPPAAPPDTATRCGGRTGARVCPPLRPRARDLAPHRNAAHAPLIPGPPPFLSSSRRRLCCSRQPPCRGATGGSSPPTPCRFARDSPTPAP